MVIAHGDPNPDAAGGGARLREAGVQVETGLMQAAAARLNTRFLHRFTGATRPFVAIKLAVTMDGFIADASGRARWISGEPAASGVCTGLAQRGFGGVAVGGRTAVADDVRLTVRGDVMPQVPPVRVIFDRSGAVSVSHGIFCGTRQAFPCGWC